MNEAPSTSGQSFRNRRLLAWMGILGMALTMIGALEPIIKLGNVAHYVLEHWHELTAMIWNWLFSIFDVRLSLVSIAFLNAGVFALAIELASMPRERVESSLWWIPLRVANALVVTGIFVLILTATALRGGLQGDPLPDPFLIENWTRKETLVPLLCMSFALIHLPPHVGVDPVLMARRLFDVAVMVAVIFALDFVAGHASLLREIISGTAGS